MANVMVKETEYVLRPACKDDFDFAWLLYRTLMKPLTVELLDWQEQKQISTVKEALVSPDTSLIVMRGVSIGWLQVRETIDNIYLAQLYIQTEKQNQGVGTAIVQQLQYRSMCRNKSLTVDVMVNNRARLLYERLGFRVVETSKYKVKMLLSDRV